MLLSGSWDGTSQLLSKQEIIDEITIRLPYLNNFNQKRSLDYKE